MATEQQQDPLTALPTVAPPSLQNPRKKKDDAELAGGTITETGDDYFGNFPTADPSGGTITHGTEQLGPVAAVPGGATVDDPSGAIPMMSPVPPPGGGIEQVGGMPGVVPPYEGGPVVEQADDLLKNFPGGGQVSPVPGGEQGIPEGGELVPEGPVSDEDLQQLLRTYAAGVLENPTRYDMDVVKEGMSQIEKELADAREQGVAGLDEMMSQRGLVGSSVEANQRSELESDLNRQRSDYAFNLLQDQARTAMADRQRAASIAASPQRLEIARRANELRNKGMDLDEAFRRAQFEAEQERFYGNIDRGEFGGTFGESQRRADLDAYYRHLEMLSQLGLDDDEFRRLADQIPKPQFSTGETLPGPKPGYFAWAQENDLPRWDPETFDAYEEEYG